MKNLLTLIIALGALFLAGCGYQVGSLMHPQVHSIAVAPVVNETPIYNAASNLRSALCERFMTDGSLELKRESNADCIIYARVTKISYSSLSWGDSDLNEDEANFQPKFWQVNATVEFSVILPGQVTPLIPKQTITGTSWFEANVDLEDARNNGIKQGMWDAAKKIVEATTEAW